MLSGYYYVSLHICFKAIKRILFCTNIDLASIGRSIVKLQVNMSLPVEEMFSKIALLLCISFRNYTSFRNMQGGIAPGSFCNSINAEKRLNCQHSRLIDL